MCLTSGAVYCGESGVPSLVNYLTSLGQCQEHNLHGFQNAEVSEAIPLMMKYTNFFSMSSSI